MNSLGLSLSHCNFSLNLTGWGDVKRLRCSPDSMLQIEQVTRLMHTIVNLSPLGVTQLGSI